MIPLPGGRRFHVAQGELKDALIAWIKEASGAERFARHEHAVKHKEYLVGVDFMFVGAGVRGLRKLAGSPFRAKFRPKETCPVCLLVRDAAAYEAGRRLHAHDPYGYERGSQDEATRQAQLGAGREAADAHFAIFGTGTTVYGSDAYREWLMKDAGEDEEEGEEEGEEEDEERKEEESE